MRQPGINIAKELLAQPSPSSAFRAGVTLSFYPAAISELEKMNAIPGPDGSIEFMTCELTYGHMPDGLCTMFDEAKKGVTAMSPWIDYWWIVP